MSGNTARMTTKMDQVFADYSLISICMGDIWFYTTCMLRELIKMAPTTLTHYWRITKLHTGKYLAAGILCYVFGGSVQQLTHTATYWDECTAAGIHYSAIYNILGKVSSSWLILLTYSCYRLPQALLYFHYERLYV